MSQDLTALLRMAKGLVKKISFSFLDEGTEVSITVSNGKQSTVLYREGEKIQDKVVEQIASLLS